ncbi:MAG: hypothetical protein P4L84_35015 [Isosphaeraceae bacterium]|nr:hypothetical protein [Isosphaeraceae bacterium]
MAVRIPLVLGSDGRPEQLQAGDQLDVPAHFGATGIATDGATVTFDMSLYDKWEVTIAGNRALAVTNVRPGQTFEIAIKQDGVGSRTVTWWTGIRWPGGAVPPLTTTQGQEDVFLFRYRGSSDYRGFVAGQNM